MSEDKTEKRAMTEDLEKRIAEIKTRANAATPGPWCVDSICVISPLLDIYITEPDSRNDAEFIAHSREDIPYLCKRLRAAEAERDELKAEVESLKNDAWNEAVERADLEDLYAEKARDE